eukprot:Polyplicarium_translucidae@DN2735_c0_g1_i2.p1
MWSLMMTRLWTVVETGLQAAPIIAVLLKRFMLDSQAGRCVKRTSSVSVPPCLSVKRCLWDPPPDDVPDDYLLQAAVTHNGRGPASGHYVCIAKETEKDENGETVVDWRLCNDSLTDSLGPTLPSDRIDGEGYLLFYVRADLVGPTAQRSPAHP